MKVCIPDFPGFYQSVYDSEIDAKFEMFGDYHLDNDFDLMDESYSKVDWRSCHEAIAKLHVEVWAELSGIPATYVRLISPREYNFQTDRVEAEVPDRYMKAMLKVIPKEVFSAYIEKHCSSRDGFISFYPPGRLWENPDNYEDPQWDIVLACFVEWKFGDEFEEEVRNEVIERLNQTDLVEQHFYLEEAA